jgi:hypothetical protein
MTSKLPLTGFSTHSNLLQWFPPLVQFLGASAVTFRRFIVGLAIGLAATTTPPRPVDSGIHRFKNV